MSYAFFIEPLAAFTLALLIIVGVVLYHIKHRNVNVTIEEATIESFGHLQSEDDEVDKPNTILVKSFFSRVKDSFTNM